MLRSLKFIVMGYLCGSVLFARICAKLFNKPEILLESKDRNPGAANAFQYGLLGKGVSAVSNGLWDMGGDLAKGFLPIFSYLRSGENFEAPSLLTAMVLVAPVLGHVFPVFFRFQGGKGISVTFGCLLGAFPNCKPLLIFALMFVAFSTVLRITPHFTRTIATYVVAPFVMGALHCSPGIQLGFAMIAAIVLMRMRMRREAHEKPKVGWL